MQLPSVFKLSDRPEPGIIELLKATRLGTKGATYRHLDTEKRINELVTPLFLYIQRREKVLGNITFCRRSLPTSVNVFYIRYFAFDRKWSASEEQEKEQKNSLFKKGLDQFFQAAFEGQFTPTPDLFYAYIEPNNTRSLWMAKNFNFQTHTQIVTWSMSRNFPRHHKQIRLLTTGEKEQYHQLLTEQYREYALFFPHHTLKDNPIIGYFEGTSLIAACKIHEVNWQIIRLPGKNGKLLTQVLPFIPFVNRIIRPSHHRFLAAEGLVSLKKDPTIIASLLQSALAITKTNLLLTWYDEKDIFAQSLYPHIKRGLANYLLPKQNVALVTKEREPGNLSTNTPCYVSAFDLI